MTNEPPSFLIVVSEPDESGLQTVDRIVNPEWTRYMNRWQTRLKHLLRWIFLDEQEFWTPINA